MKLIAKSHIARLWIMILLGGLSLLKGSALYSAPKDDTSNNAVLPPVSIPVETIIVPYSPEIGDKYCGGIIFYLLPPSLKHGLVAAIEDIPGHSSGAPEGNYTWADAQTACNDFVSNGYSDWFMPDKEQLNRLCRIAETVGGFSQIRLHLPTATPSATTVKSGHTYWSSSEYRTEEAWSYTFGFTNRLIHENKMSYNRVRAVRAF
jgi:hypothetical protein